MRDQMCQEFSITRLLLNQLPIPNCRMGRWTPRRNVATDKAVKETQSAVGKAWEVKVEGQNDLRYTATMAGTILEIDIRQALKMQTTRR